LNIFSKPPPELEVNYNSHLEYSVDLFSPHTLSELELPYRINKERKTNSRTDKEGERERERERERMCSIL
jgi:hypothetical protein